MVITHSHGLQAALYANGLEMEERVMPSINLTVEGLALDRDFMRRQIERYTDQVVRDLHKEIERDLFRGWSTGADFAKEPPAHPMCRSVVVPIQEKQAEQGSRATAPRRRAIALDGFRKR